MKKNHAVLIIACVTLLIALAGYLVLRDYVLNKQAAPLAQRRPQSETARPAQNPAREVERLEQIIKQRPREAWAHARKGALLNRQGRYAEAVESLDEAAKLDDKDPQIFFERAAAKFDKKDFKGAREDLTKVIELLPQSAQAYFNRAVAALNMDDFDAAAADFKKASRLFAQAGDAQNARAASDAAFETGEYKKYLEQNPQARAAPQRQAAAQTAAPAGGQIAASAPLAPKGAPVANPKDNLALMNANPQAAKEQIAARLASALPSMAEKFRAVAGGKSGVMPALGDMAGYQAAARAALTPQAANYAAAADDKMRRGDYGGAARDLSKAIAQNPGSSELFSKRAAANAAAGNQKAAMEDINKAISLDPGNAGAYRQRAAQHAAAGNPQAAAADMQTYGQLSQEALARRQAQPQQQPEQEALKQKYDQAVEAFNKKDFEAAGKLFKELGEETKDPAMYLNAGHAYLNLGDSANALSNYNATTALAPEMEEPYLASAEAYMKDKNYEAAQKSLEEVFKINPKNAVAALRGGEVSLLQGNEGEARRKFEAALTLAEGTGDKETAQTAREIMAGLSKLDEERKKEDKERKQAQADNNAIETAGELMAKGEVAGALAIYEDLRKRYPGNAGLIYNAAVAYLSSGDYARAAEDLNKVIAKQPSNAAAFYWRAVAGAEMGGDKSQAAADAAKAASLAEAQKNPELEAAARELLKLLPLQTQTK
ncbi:MAG: tetratricopeptide repeat protein [Elusimicrobiota bacterium]|nr:tetratricopeptide repeat protein [Elusimicrobiota bacterium]